MTTKKAQVFDMTKVMSDSTAGVKSVFEYILSKLVDLEDAQKVMQGKLNK